MKKQRLSMPPVIVERSPKRKNGQKIKQLLSLLLTVCLIIGLVPQTAYAKIGRASCRERVFNTV